MRVLTLLKYIVLGVPVVVFQRATGKAALAEPVALCIKLDANVADTAFPLVPSLPDKAVDKLVLSVALPVIAPKATLPVEVDGVAQ